MQLTRPRMVQLLNILQFPSPLLELADRFRLPERVLREILGQPQSEWETLVRQSIQNSLTSDDIVEHIAAKDEKKSTSIEKSTRIGPTPERNALRSLRRFMRVFRKIDALQQSEILDSLADELVINKQAKETLQIMEEFISLLNARLKRR